MSRGPSADQIARDLHDHTADAPFVIVARDRSSLPPARGTWAYSTATVDGAIATVRALDERGCDLYVVRNPVADGRLYLGDDPRVPVVSNRIDADQLNAMRALAGLPPVVADERGPDLDAFGNPPRLVDVSAIVDLPIDIDPKTADHAAARDHAKQLLDQLDRRVPIYRVSDSGRGIQAGVRIAAARAGTTAWDAARLLGRRIEAWLAARADAALVSVDPVSNPNRFTRLAGTTNTRTGRATRVLYSRPDRVVVNPTGLLAEVEACLPGERSLSEDVELSDDLPEVDEAALAGRVGAGSPLHRLIVDGPRAGEDRSRQMGHAACALLRRGVDDDTIAGILLDDRYRIGDHAREQRNPRRAVERALEWAHRKVDPLIELFRGWGQP